jgi:nicotinamidase-related amidase
MLKISNFILGGMKMNPTKITIDPRKTALLLLHWVNDIADPRGKVADDLPDRMTEAGTIEHTKTVLGVSRKKGMLIIYVNPSHRPGYPEIPAKPCPISSHIAEVGAFVRGSWGAEVIDELKPLESEIVIANYSPSAFRYTEIDLILRNYGITDLVLTGLVTNFVVETTARDAVNVGYSVTILEDCCKAPTDDMHNWTMSNVLPKVATISNSTQYMAALHKFSGLP